MFGRSKRFPVLLILIVLLIFTATPVLAQAGPPGAVEEFQLSPELIVSITGALVSLVFSYFPALRSWFAGLAAEAKSGVMLLLMAIVVAVVVLANCNGWLNAGITCDQIGLQQVIWWYILAVIGNQTTYQVSPPADDVRTAKRLRGVGEA